MIKFDFKNNIKYDWKNRIRASSRLLTLIDIEIRENDREIFVNKCNEILSEIRYKTSDIILSPFKGNMKNGQRRRRLDFLTCRAIVEKAYNNLYGTPEISITTFFCNNNNLNKRSLNARQQALF